MFVLFPFVLPVFIFRKGTGEPDPSKDIVIQIDGKSVTVPQGPRIPQPQHTGSRFDKVIFVCLFYYSSLLAGTVEFLERVFGLQGEPAPYPLHA